MKRITKVLGALLLLWGFVGAPAYAEPSLQDVLDEACQISGASALCQVSDLIKELGTNVEQFLDAGRDEIRSRLTGGLTDVVQGLVHDVGSGIELPPELASKLKEIVDLPNQYRDDYQQALSKVDELKKSLTDDLVQKIHELMASGEVDDFIATVDGEEVDLQTMLARAAETPEPCSRLVNTSPMSDEYADLARECAGAHASRRQALSDFLDQASSSAIDLAEKSRDLNAKEEANSNAQRQVEGAKILANAQASAERLATDYSLAGSAKEAASRASELADNAQNASSTRAAVQVLAEGIGDMLESNVASLAAVQMSLAELAQQQVYTNEQINRVASNTVKDVAEERSSELEEAVTDTTYLQAVSQAFLEQGDSIVKQADLLFDTSCAKKSHWWEEGCQ